MKQRIWILQKVKMKNEVGNLISTQKYLIEASVNFEYFISIVNKLTFPPGWIFKCLFIAVGIPKFRWFLIKMTLYEVPLKNFDIFLIATYIQHAVVGVKHKITWVYIEEPNFVLNSIIQYFTMDLGLKCFYSFFFKSLNKFYLS